MKIRQGAFTLLHGAIAVLAAGWLAAGSCSVSYSSCTHDPGDCSAPEHDRDCPCYAGSTVGLEVTPPRALAVEVEVDASRRTRVRRWLVTERGCVPLERARDGAAPTSGPAPFARP